MKWHRLYKESDEQVNLKKLLKLNGVTKLPSGTEFKLDRISWSKDGGYAGQKTLEKICSQLEDAGWKRGEWRTGGIPDGSAVTNSNAYTSPDGQLMMTYSEHFGATAHDNYYGFTFKLVGNSVNESRDDMMIATLVKIDENGEKEIDMRQVFNGYDAIKLMEDYATSHAEDDDWVAEKYAMFASGEDDKGKMQAGSLLEKNGEISERFLTGGYEIQLRLYDSAYNESIVSEGEVPYKTMEKYSKQLKYAWDRFEEIINQPHIDDYVIRHKGRMGIAWDSLLPDDDPYHRNHELYDAICQYLSDDTVVVRPGSNEWLVSFPDMINESSRFGFNVGDKVELKDDVEPNRFSGREAVPAGTVGEIVAIDKPMPGAIKVKLNDGTVVTMGERQLKLAGTDDEEEEESPDKPEDFKWGDRVQLIKPYTRKWNKEFFAKGTKGMVSQQYDLDPDNPKTIGVLVDYRFVNISVPPDYLKKIADEPKKSKRNIRPERPEDHYGVRRSSGVLNYTGD